MVAPTMQCVPEIGSLRKEAASCHTAEPNDKGIDQIRQDVDLKQAFLNTFADNLNFFFYNSVV